MSWPEVVSQGFPPPRDGELAHLRRDITDELADHLDCAMRRELRRTDDETAAERAVLDRFGNPQRLARRLWWNAMKEKVMKDRIMLVAVVLLIAACVVTSAFAWLAFRQGRDVNQAMLAKLAELSVPSAEPGIPGDWSKVTFRLTEGSAQGEPVTNTGVGLKGKVFNDSEEQTLHKRADGDGLVTFGPIRPGHYQYEISRRHGFALTRVFDLYPGREHEIAIACPSLDMGADIAFAVGWPAHLRDRRLLVKCHFVPSKDSVRVGETWWSVGAFQTVVTPDGMLMNHWGSGPPAGMRKPRNGFFPATGLFCDRDRLQWEQHIRRPALDYRLKSILVFSPVHDPKRPSRQAWNDCAIHQYSEEQRPVLKARHGEVNRWQIELPEPLLEQVRKHAAEQSTSAPSSG